MFQWFSNGNQSAKSHGFYHGFSQWSSNDVRSYHGFYHRFSNDVPMENHPKSWFLPWIEHDGNLQAFGFLPVLWIPKKLASPSRRDGPKMWCLKLRIPKMTVFLLGKMMINKITSNFRSTLIMFPKKNVQTNTSISPVVQSFLIGMKLVDREKVHLSFFSLKNSSLWNAQNAWDWDFFYWD